MTKPAGYSGTPLAQKLGIAAGCVLALRGDAAGLAPVEDCVPDDVDQLGPRSRAPYDVAVLAVRSRGALEREFGAFAAQAKPTGALWVAWPKKTSPLAGDLGENEVRAIGLAAGVVDVKVCAIDADWSGLKFVRRLVDRPKATGSRPRARRSSS